MKEERMAILRLLEKGILSVDEAERLLNALQNTNKKDLSESINGILSKTGDTLEVLAQKIGRKAGAAAKAVGDKAEEVKPEIKKAAKVVKEKVSETAENIKNRKNSEDIFDADFSEEEAVETAEETAAVNEEPKAEAEADEKELKDFIPQASDEDFKVYEDEDTRDYEAEFYRMMGEINGDIFSEVIDPVDDVLFQAQKEWEELKETEGFES